MAKMLFTSESVTEGHPDKVADQISDAVLDAILEKDPNGRVACETSVTTGMVFCMGEITTSCYVDFPKIARKVVEENNQFEDIGWYTDEKGNTAIDRTLLKVKVGVPQYKATFFNNQVDAEEMIKNIKKFKPILVSYLPTDDAPSVDELKVFALDIVREVK